ncbi:hypothetical protein VHEMI03719 [[Torrubiella] hemipterigena]|uniref:DUF7707 domain-containing protein n=1 Tax=[Torrubiella] hemipterigena TaxID=1531966 RepID=A0A0A1TBQ7_9HYPO|nr:hypothetical protein VHEMI03719 [[Torrubiella] hemipterigena]
MVALRTVLAASVLAVASADLTIDPNSVPLLQREGWCEDQRRTCPIICQQVEPRTTKINTCDAKTLQYGCLCGNNLQPNVSEYSLSIPYYVCRAYVQQCQTACKNNNICQSNCVEQHPCGATNPTRVNKTEKPAASHTSDPSQTFSDVPGANKNGAAGVLETAGRSYGLAVVFFSMFAGFAML